MEVAYNINDKEVSHEKFDLVKGHSNDSGFDLYTPAKLSIKAGQRITLNLQTRFAIPKLNFILRLFGFGIEGQIRPKSGRSKSGLDAEFGTIDQAYRGYVGVTLTNTTGKLMKFAAGEKICQIVWVPVFNKIKMTHTDEFDINTARGENGFGSTGLV